MTHSRGKNLSDILCRARLYPMNNIGTGDLDNYGWYPCKKCKSCKHSFDHTKSVHIYNTNRECVIKQILTCEDNNVIYLIECRKCMSQYIGSTIQKYKLRQNGWRSDISLNTKTDYVVKHFNQRGHCLERDFRMVPLEKVYGNEEILRARERMYIDNFGLIDVGLNSNRTQ